MTDDEIEELLGAYALDAVTDDEHRAVRRYIEANPRARSEVESYREVAAHLAMGSATPPPPGVWDRIAAELDSAVPKPGPELSRVMGDGPTPQRRSWLAAAAAAAVAVVGAVVITLAVTDDASEPGDPGTAIEQAYGDARSDPDRRRATLASADATMTADGVILPDGRGFVSVRDLPTLASNETYQLWGVFGDGDVISLGVLGNRPGIEPFTARGDIDAIVVTKERAGGVISSTNEPLLTGDLT